jgi:hypothetical protein
MALYMVEQRNPNQKLHAKSAGVTHPAQAAQALLKLLTLCSCTDYPCLVAFFFYHELIMQSLTRCHFRQL